MKMTSKQIEVLNELLQKDDVGAITELYDEAYSKGVAQTISTGVIIAGGIFVVSKLLKIGVKIGEKIGEKIVDKIK